MRKLSRVLLALCVLMLGVSFAWAEGNGEATTASGERPVLEFYQMIGGTGNPDLTKFDPSNNPVINWVNDKAGVKIKVTGPKIVADAVTEVNLLLASGDLPDIMHSGWLYPAVDQAAVDGAFIPLNDYWNNSPLMQKRATAEMMAMCVASDGKNYRIPTDQRRGWKVSYNIVRSDLIDEVNGGHMPTTVPEWTTFFQNIKKTYPAATPLTSWSLPAAPWWSTKMMFAFYGVDPWGLSVYNGKVVYDFERPAYRAAVAYYRQAYKDGIMDNEFATQPRSAMEAKFHNNIQMAAIRYGRTYWCIGWCITDPEKNPEGDAQKWVYAPPLTEAPEGVSDIRWTYSTSESPIYGNGTYIATQTPDHDLAWKVLEAFGSPEVQNMHDWGIEGVQYTMKDGERYITDSFGKPPHSNWNIFGFMTGYDDATAKEQTYKRTNPEAYARFKASYDAHDGYYQQRGISVASFLTPTDRIAEKKGEALEFINTATAKAITGDSSMEDFDAAVAQFQKKYGFISEDYTNQLNENKEDWIKRGCLEINF